MPIQAAANRVKQELASGQTKSEPGQSKTQSEILQMCGIPDDEVAAFAESEHWLRYFPPKATEDLQAFGLCADWRRSMITTSMNPYYDSFIRWQFNTLRANNKIHYGKKYTIYSALDKQPCADHDRAEGEGVGVQEYAGIKIQLLELPESLSHLQGKDIFLVAATLRAETMYGQTNCFVLPTAQYGVYKMKTGEYFVCSDRAAKHFAYQEMMDEFGVYEPVAHVLGQDLIGKPLKAPLCPFEVVYALPMETISMDKGTGIVTSVPSDAPDDWAALRDLQTKEAIRDKYGVKLEWCEPFKPVPIINIAEYGDLTAVTLCDKFKIKSQKDKEALGKAKKEAYLKGFYDGRMLVGICKGELVETAKVKCKKYLIDNGLAVAYAEPESPVISRTKD